MDTAQNAHNQELHQGTPNNIVNDTTDSHETKLDMLISMMENGVLSKDWWIANTPYSYTCNHCGANVRNLCKVNNGIFLEPLCEKCFFKIPYKQNKIN